ncbi:MULTISPECIES: AraC family transcriptional regulator [unclassified Sphingomonas]|uniref:AraC family transcriptional regulator n=1 Tax=unclassified Sphingomonas TaxID=196159 RepID=UPI00082EC6F7|nr:MULTISPECIES: AraC family transcriptional regulator [unclassified Sphingomonas]
MSQPLLAFAQPSPAAAPFATLYYLFRSEASVVEGIERADIGQIRFMLNGAGAVTFPDGRCERSTPVMIHGPGTGAARYRVEGPFHCFGVALRPIGWGALVGLPAHERADHLTDGATIWGDAMVALIDRLRAADDVEAMKAIVEPVLLAHARPIPDAHHRLAEAVRQWLASDGPICVDGLFARVALSPRQVTRWVNHYFGAPPKFLERKFRAVRAASDLVEGADPAEVAGRFYDQSHMIREIRHFTGHTPGTLASAIDPVLALTLQSTAFNELAPVTAPPHAAG